jgi:hypothetical protein
VDIDKEVKRIVSSAYEKARVILDTNKDKLERIAQALVGDYRPEHLFALQTAYDMYLAYEAKIHQCDERLIQELENLPDKVDLKLKPLPPKAPKKQIDEGLRTGLYRKLGVDITAIEGIGARVGLAMLTEVGPDLSAFRSEKQFSVGK